MKRIIVRTRRLILRAYKKNDYLSWKKAITTPWPLSSRWDRPAKSKRWADQRRFQGVLRRHHKLARSDQYYFFAIFEKKSGDVVGVIDFKIFDRQDLQFANLGYAIFFPYRRQGLATEAARAALKMGFAQLKLNRLEAVINLDNLASQKLARKIGMRREGIRKRFWYEDKKWVDHVVFVANPEDIGMKARRPFIASR